jgi:hypothetical protein
MVHKPKDLLSVCACCLHRAVEYIAKKGLCDVGYWFSVALVFLFPPQDGGVQ